MITYENDRAAKKIRLFDNRMVIYLDHFGFITSVRSSGVDHTSLRHNSDHYYLSDGEHPLMMSSAVILRYDAPTIVVESLDGGRVITIGQTIYDDLFTADVDAVIDWRDS